MRDGACEMGTGDSRGFCVEGEVYDDAVQMISHVLGLLDKDRSFDFSLRRRFSGAVSPQSVWLLMFYDQNWFRHARAAIDRMVEVGTVSQSVLEEIDEQRKAFDVYPDFYRGTPVATHPDLLVAMTDLKMRARLVMHV